jgi:hypothetical protein
MMNANQIADYRELKDHGVEVTRHNQIQPNDGSESLRHLQAKATVAYIGLQNDYRIGSEVIVSGCYEIDILLWGNTERDTYAVECETSPTQETMNEKLEQYVKNVGPIDDMLTVNLNEISDNRCEMLGDVSDQIGLRP